MDDSVNRRRVERSRRRPSTRGGGCQSEGLHRGSQKRERRRRGDRSAENRAPDMGGAVEGTFSGPGPRSPHVFTDPRTRGCASAQSDAGPPASKRGGADSRGEGRARPAARRSSRGKCACREVLDDGGALSAERPLEVVDEALSFCLALIILSQVSFRDPP